MDAQAVRTTVVLPARVAELLRKLVPARKRSEFVAEAIEQRLTGLEQREARVRSFGAWRDEDHPDLQTAEDLRRFIGSLRDESSWRRSAREE